MLLINLATASVASANGEDNKEDSARQIREAVNSLGIGKDVRVEVRLKNSTKVKGHISEIGSDSFVLIREKTGENFTVHYSDVKEIKGMNISTGKKIAIGVGVSLGVIFLIWALYSSSD